MSRIDLPIRLILLTVPFRATQCFLALGMPRPLSHIISIRLVSLFAITPIGFHLFGLPRALWSIVLGPRPRVAWRWR
jgi:hypothetical protein